MHRGASIKQTVNKMLLYFTNISAEILLHILGYNFWNEYHILVQLFNMLLTLKVSINICAKGALHWHKNYGKIDPARNKRSSLLRSLVNYGRKKLYNIGPWRWCHPCSRQTCRKSLKCKKFGIGVSIINK